MCEKWEKGNEEIGWMIGRAVYGGEWSFEKDFSPPCTRKPNHSQRGITLPTLGGTSAGKAERSYTMKNAMRFFFSFLAAFMVAIACSGNPPPTEETGNGNDPNPQDPTNPDPNTGCEPDCPVSITTVMRGLSYALPGEPDGEVQINGTLTGTRMTLDGSRTMIRTPLNELMTITVEGAGRDGDSVRFFMIDGVMSTMDDVGRDINLTQTGLYPNLGGDWRDLDYPNRAARMIEMFWSITTSFSDSKYQCPDTEVAFGGMTWGLTCIKHDNTLSNCAGPDMDNDGVPDAPSDPRCNRVVVGATMVDAQGTKGEEIIFQEWVVFNGVMDRSITSEYRFGRLVRPW